MKSIGTILLAAVFLGIGLAIRNRLKAEKYRESQRGAQRVVMLLCFGTAAIWVAVAVVALLTG